MLVGDGALGEVGSPSSGQPDAGQAPRPGSTAGCSPSLPSRPLHLAKSRRRPGCNQPSAAAALVAGRRVPGREPVEPMLRPRRWPSAGSARRRPAGGRRWVPRWPGPRRRASPTLRPGTPSTGIRQPGRLDRSGDGGRGDDSGPEAGGTPAGQRSHPRRARPWGAGPHPRRWPPGRGGDGRAPGLEPAVRGGRACSGRVTKNDRGRDQTTVMAVGDD